MSGITPCLWFDGDAEEAAKFYASCSTTAMLMQSIALRVTTRRARQATCCSSSSHSWVNRSAA